MAKKKEIKKEKKVPEATEELNSVVIGEIMNESGIVGDGALIKNAE